EPYEDANADEDVHEAIELGRQIERTDALRIVGVHAMSLAQPGDDLFLDVGGGGIGSHDDAGPSRVAALIEGALRRRERNEERIVDTISLRSRLQAVMLADDLKEDTAVAQIPADGILLPVEHARR